MESPAAQAAQDPPTLEGYVRRIESLLKKILPLGGFDLAVAIRRVPAGENEPEGAEWIVDFSGRDADLLLESHAALLDALGHLASKAVRLDESLHKKIVFDCQDYRRMRTEELKLTALLAAERVIDSGEPFSLNPMNSSDRRIVHLALKDQLLVRTESQGMGPGRRVVILPTSSKH